MAQGFGENFRGGRAYVICPLCDSHLDNQEEYFYNCKYLQQMTNTQGNYYELFNENVPQLLIKTISKISMLRR